MGVPGGSPVRRTYHFFQAKEAVNSSSSLTYKILKETNEATNNIKYQRE
jgi:hypothetical protein